MVILIPPLKQTRQDHIVGCFDSQCRRLSKNMAPDSESMTPTKNVTTIKNNIKLLNSKSTSFTALSFLTKFHKPFDNSLNTLEIIQQQELL